MWKALWLLAVPVQQSIQWDKNNANAINSESESSLIDDDVECRHLQRPEEDDDYLSRFID
jgi:hypothetical protein